MATATQIANFVNNHFGMLDKDGSGFLEKAEIHEIIKTFHANHGAGNDFNEELFEGLWGKIDRDGTGKISQERLTEAITNFARNNGFLNEE